MLFKRFSRCGAVAIALCLIVGCNDGTYNSADILGTISAQNAEAIAQDGSSAVEFLTQQSGIAESFADEIATPGSIQSACTSGTAVVQVYDGGVMGQVTQGDYVYVTFNACTMDLGGVTVQFDGTIWVTATQATGMMPSPYTREFKVDYFGLSIMVGGDSVTVQGTYWSYSSDDGATQIDRVYGNRLIVTAMSSGALFAGTIFDFSVTHAVDVISDAYTTDIVASYSSTAASGYVTVMTPTPFAGPDAQSDPASGVMTVMGDLGGVITLTALDSINVQLDVDVDGDGTPEATIATTWAFIKSGSGSSMP